MYTSICKRKQQRYCNKKCFYLKIDVNKRLYTYTYKNSTVITKGNMVKKSTHDLFWWLSSQTLICCKIYFAHISQTFYRFIIYSDHNSKIYHSHCKMQCKIYEKQKIRFPNEFHATTKISRKQSHVVLQNSQKLGVFFFFFYNSQSFHS